MIEIDWRSNMRYGYDAQEKKVHIDKSLPNELYHCGTCGCELIRKLGNKRVHHFAHRPNEICKDNWHYAEMSEWHIGWQMKYPEECQEVVKEFDGKRHRADVLIEDQNLVIEFQHSPIKIEEFRDRNSFYRALGYQVVWVFDFISLFDDKCITLERPLTYSWNNPKNVFSSMEYLFEDTTIYIQTGNQLECVVYAYEHFRHFICKKGNDLSPGKIEIESFVSICMSNGERLVQEKLDYRSLGEYFRLEKFVDKEFDYANELDVAVPYSVPGGVIIDELWSEKYDYMCVKNIFTEVVYDIHGVDGKITYFESPTDNFGSRRNNQFTSLLSNNRRVKYIPNREKKVWKLINSRRDYSYEDRIRIQKERELLKVKEEKARVAEEAERKRIQEEEAAIRENEYNTLEELKALTQDGILFAENMNTRNVYFIKFYPRFSVGLYDSDAMIIKKNVLFRFSDYYRKIWRKIEIKREKQIHSKTEVEEWIKEHGDYSTLDEIALLRKEEKSFLVINKVTGEPIKLVFRAPLVKYATGDQKYDYITRPRVDYKEYKIWELVKDK